jgi:glutaredoxin-related protein
MTKDIVYKATVTSSNPSKIMNYIGMTSTTFKEHLANHNYTFEHKELSNKTELSKYIWTLKDNKKDFNNNWQILKRAISYIREDQNDVIYV